MAIADEIKQQGEEVKEQAKEVYREAKPWVERLARYGYMSKGLVYILLGLAIFRALRGWGTTEVDPRDAFMMVVTEPFFGPLLLGLVALGLAGYVLWRFVQAVADPQKKGKDLHGLVKRGGYIASALAYAGLVLLALQLLLGIGAAAGEASSSDWTLSILAHPVGPWLFGLIAVGFLGFGAFQLYLAFTANFKEKLHMEEMDADERKWAIAAGRVGFIARAVLSISTGIFIFHSIGQYRLSEAASMGEVLQALAQQAYGPVLLGGLAIGLIAFGVYHFVIAWHGRYMS